ncbi:hypothetical protein [Aquirufa sp. 5-AUSEE-100C1]
MEIFVTAILALAVGLTFGFKFKKGEVNKEKTSPQWAEKTPHFSNPSGLENTISIYFDILEVRFIKRLLESENDELSVGETNEILRIEKLSKENQRQRRHLFLKELNMKLKMIFNINECIERQSTELDRRSKTYSLNSQVNTKLLIELIENKS